MIHQVIVSKIGGDIVIQLVRVCNFGGDIVIPHARVSIFGVDIVIHQVMVSNFGVDPLPSRPWCPVSPSILTRVSNSGCHGFHFH